jgi:hypothetical protein
MKYRTPSAAEEKAEGEGKGGGCTCGKGCGKGSGCRAGKGGGRMSMAQAALKRVKTNVRRLTR